MAKKIAPPQKPDRDVTTHVQGSAGDSAMAPELPGAPAFNPAVIAEAEGLVSRDDLLASSPGMSFGSLAEGAGEAPENGGTEWTPA
jgi:hypothetical protein